MKQRTRIYYTESQKALMRERWRKGESLQQIAQLFDRNHSSVERILAETGGIRPAQRCRSRLALTLPEREEISRAVVAGQSARSIATALGRAPSTISREIKRNGGQECYRASKADQAAWDRTHRPKTCKLVENRTLARIVAAKLPRAVVTGTDCRMAEADIPKRRKLSGVIRDYLSQPIYPGPRRIEEGASGALATYASYASFTSSHSEDRRSRQNKRYHIYQ